MITRLVGVETDPGPRVPPAPQLNRRAEDAQFAKVAESCRPNSERASPAGARRLRTHLETTALPLDGSARWSTGAPGHVLARLWSSDHARGSGRGPLRRPSRRSGGVTVSVEAAGDTAPEWDVDVERQRSGRPDRAPSAARPSTPPTEPASTRRKTHRTPSSASWSRNGGTFVTHRPDRRGAPPPVSGFPAALSVQNARTTTGGETMH